MRLRRHEPVVDQACRVVYDREGMPVGVHVAAATAEADTPASRYARGVESLRRTRELETQYAWRCQVSLFYGDPPR